MTTQTIENDFRTVDINSVQPNPVALRAVDSKNEQYINLSRDIGRRGLLKPILVREKVDEATQESYFELCDGLQRYSACVENGFTEIPVKVQDLSDAEVEETQIAANLCKVDTKPIEYTKQLMRMMQRNPTMTEANLAEMISQSPSFVRQRLGLLKLDESIQQLVNNGDIGLANAYAMAKLPHDEQHNFTDAAMTQPPSEFVAAVNARSKEIKDAAREGKKAGEATFSPRPKVKKQAVLLAEHENAEIGGELCNQYDVTTAVEGFALGIAFALSLDPASVQEQEAVWNKAKAEQAAEKAKRAAAREERKRRDAAEKASVAREESGIDEDELEALIAEQEAAEAERAAAKAAAKEEKEENSGTEDPNES